MKITLWDILSILGVLLICACGALVMQILINPYTAINPFPPATLPPTISIPTDTATLIPLPATWTPVGVQAGATLRPSSTMPPTATGFVLPTHTSTFTLTPTVTETPTPTITRTPTSTFTFTSTNTLVPPTPDLTGTTASRNATDAAFATYAAGVSTSVAATAQCQATLDAGGTCP